MGSSPQNDGYDHGGQVFSFTTDMSYEGEKRSKSLLLSLGIRPCSLMRMLSHESELPRLAIPIRLVCPQADRKRQNKIAAQGSTK